MRLKRLTFALAKRKLAQLGHDSCRALHFLPLKGEHGRLLVQRTQRLPVALKQLVIVSNEGLQAQGVGRLDTEPRR